MGVCGADSKHLKVDFHGLFIEEAKQVIDAYILPVLSVIRKVVLITGRGVHSKKQVAKLKLALKSHFAKMTKIKCEELSDNEGALCIYAQ
jgi:DNA-nicking Smr family endonuclease